MALLITAFGQVLSNRGELRVPGTNCFSHESQFRLCTLLSGGSVCLLADQDVCFGMPIQHFSR